MLLGMAFMGCQEKEVVVADNRVSHDVETYKVEASRPSFLWKGEQTDAAFSKLNQAISDLVDGLVDSLRVDANEFFREMEELDMERPAWRYELMVEDSVFMVTPDFVSVRLTVYEFRGGAHGMTAFHSFNYDVKNQKLLTNEEILDYGKSAVVDAGLKANFENPDGCFNLEPTLADATVVNVTPESLCFTYEQYVLGPYACGVAEVEVPRATLKEALRIR